jgi:hypothetical protein
VLILDEPDVQTADVHDVWQGWGSDALRPVDHLFMTVREWCDAPPFVLAGLDADPLYRTHGDPRD